MVRRTTRTSRCNRVYSADDLKLYIDNDGDLYRSTTTYVHKGLEKKMKRGVFDAARAPAAFKYLVDAGAKKWAREEGTPDRWNSMFTPATRKQVAKDMAEEWAAEYRIQHGTAANRGKRRSRRSRRNPVPRRRRTSRPKKRTSRRRR